MGENLVESTLSWLLPVLTLGMVVGVQVLFWMPTSSEPSTVDKNEAKIFMGSTNTAQSSPVKRQINQEKVSSQERTLGRNGDSNFTTDNGSSSLQRKDVDETPETSSSIKEKEEEDLFRTNNDTWRCACEGGFLPPGMLKSFGGAEAMMRLGTGQCYHKQA